jgi:two-component system nitrate/nitrite response regulator NarL
MVYEASDLDGALSCLRSMTSGHMDLVILDAALCNDRANAVGAVQREGGPARVVVLGQDTNAIDDQLLAADGFLTFDITADTMIRSLSLVHNGERVVPRELMQAIAARSREGGQKYSGPAPLPRPSLSHALSRRESEILQRLLRGQTNKTIGRDLGITETTVKIHLKSLLRKIGASNRTQAAIWALNNGHSAYGTAPWTTGSGNGTKPTEINDHGRKDGPLMGNRRGKPA